MIDYYYGYAFSFWSTNTYDTNGHVLTSRSTFDDGNDGTIDQLYH